MKQPDNTGISASVLQEKKCSSYLFSRQSLIFFKGTNLLKIRSLGDGSSLQRCWVEPIRLTIFGINDSIVVSELAFFINSSIIHGLKYTAVFNKI